MHVRDSNIHLIYLIGISGCAQEYFTYMAAASMIIDRGGNQAVPLETHHHPQVAERTSHTQTFNFQLLQYSR